MAVAAAVIDIADLVTQWAEQMFRTTRNKEQARVSKDNIMININWSRVKFTHNSPDFMDYVPVIPKAQVLFKTHFTNRTDQEQEYSFKTERTTRSICDVNIEKGVTVGQEMSIKLATPCDVFEANAGFKREVTLTNSQGQTFEEEVTWGVDNQIKVPKKHKVTAELVVSEAQSSGSFLIKTQVSGKVLVTVTNRKDNNSLLESMTGDIAEILRQSSENNFVIEKGIVTFETRGHCHFIFATEQHVELTQESLNSTTQNVMPNTAE